jgi:DNA polymerase III sliding clamp (beta) subunit (PCNA family)
MCIMLITVLKERLLQTLNRAATTTGHDTSHPLTAAVRLEVTKDVLTVSSTNLIASTIASCPCVSKTTGIAVVNCSRLIAIISGFDEKVEILLQLIKDKLIVRCQSRRYEMRTHAIDGFPNVAITADSDSSVTLSPFALRIVFERVQRFTAEDPIFMDGIYMRTSGTTLEACAFSSPHVARATVPISETASQQWFLPRTFFKSAEKMFSEAERVTISCGRYVSLETDGYRTGTLITEGAQTMAEGLTFVRDQLMQIESHEKVAAAGINVDAWPLNKVCGAVAIGFTKLAFAPVTLNVATTEFGNSFCISGSDEDGDCGDVADIVPILGKPNPLTVKLNLAYLMDVLKSIGQMSDNRQIAMQLFSGDNLPLPQLALSTTNLPDPIGTAAYLISPLGEKKR